MARLSAFAISGAASLASVIASVEQDQTGALITLAFGVLFLFAGALTR